MASVFDFLQVWTKQENNAGIILPEIPNVPGTGAVAGTLLYPPVKFNNGSDDQSTVGNYFQYPDNKVVLDPNCWVVEFHFNPNGWSLTDGLPSDTTNHRIWDWYLSNNDRITIQIISGSGLRWQDVVGAIQHITTFTTGATWTDALHHILFVFDRTGIAGGVDTRRIYLDGSLILQSSISVANQTSSGGTLHFHTIFFNSVPFNSFESHMDNLKMYSGFTSGISEAFVTEVLNNKDNEGQPSAILPVGLNRLNRIEGINLL